MLELADSIETIPHYGDQLVHVVGLLDAPRRLEPHGLPPQVMRGRDKKHRDVSEVRISALLGTERRAIHHRHMEIEQDDGRLPKREYHQGLESIRRRANLE